MDSTRIYAVFVIQVCFQLIGLSPNIGIESTFVKVGDSNPGQFRNYII